MAYADSFADDIVIGLTPQEIRVVAKRQFIASLAAALVIAAGAGLLAIAQSSNEHGRIGQQIVASVHQPTFVKAQERMASAEVL